MKEDISIKADQIKKKTANGDANSLNAPQYKDSLDGNCLVFNR